jgi:hypothetical protein
VAASDVGAGPRWIGVQDPPPPLLVPDEVPVEPSSDAPELVPLDVPPPSSPAPPLDVDPELVPELDVPPFDVPPPDPDDPDDPSDPDELPELLAPWPPTPLLPIPVWSGPALLAQAPIATKEAKPQPRFQPRVCIGPSSPRCAAVALWPRLPFPTVTCG